VLQLMQERQSGNRKQKTDVIITRGGLPEQFCKPTKAQRSHIERNIPFLNIKPNFFKKQG